MFRRRPIRRPPLRRGPRPVRRAVRRVLRRARPLPAAARQLLIRANRLYNEGQYAEAAAVFEQLANGSEKGGMLARAAQLSLQAARAYLAIDEVEPALARARKAIQLLVQAGRPDRIPVVVDRASEALRSKGFNAEADQLEQDAAQALEELGLSMEDARRQAPGAAERRGTLPASCAGCGAPLTPDGVDWHDAQTAECPYCGTIAKTI